MSPIARRGLLLAAIGALLWLLWHSGLIEQLNLENLKTRQQDLEAWRAAHPWTAAGGFLAIYILAAALSLPGAAILTLTAGALFGLVQGTLLASFAASIGATLAFLLARFLLGDALRARYAQRWRTFDEGVARDGIYYLLTLRLVPLFPFFVINVLAGLTSLRTWTFYWVSQLGMLPGALAYTYAGTQLARIEAPGDVLSPGLLLAFALLAALPWTMRWLIRALQARRVYRGHRRPRRFDYNLLVIGAGSAGLVTAYIGATVRARVALIERGAMGGDCLNTGCVPSKALLRSARLLAEIRDARRYGLRRAEAEWEFGEIMDRVREVIARIAPHDSVARYTELGVEVIAGEARLVSPWEVEVDGRRLSARSLVLATGAEPLVPELPGLDALDYLTSDNLWSLRTLPRRLLVLGGGPIGCELGQAFARLGSAVALVEMAPRLLPREDPEVGAELTVQLTAEGVAVLTDCKALRAGSDPEGGHLVCERDGEEITLGFDRVLIALGRRPRVTGFGLEELGVTLGPRGTITNNEFMQTNLPNILVAGDAAGPYQFTHAAAHQAWFAAVNGLLAPLWRFRTDYRVIPWVTFTEPEIARVGLSETEARERGIAVEITRYDLGDLDRAITESADRGFVKVLTAPGKDRILGALIVGTHAGELLAQFVLAMKQGIGLNRLLGTIHAYPTFGEAVKFTAGTWKRAHAPQGALRLAERYFRWRRG